VTTPKGTATSNALFTIGFLPNAITFEPMPKRATDTEWVVLLAKASSGLPITFEVVSGLAAQAGDTLAGSYLAVVLHS
jgi:hypothetical protein